MRSSKKSSASSPTSEPPSSASPARNVRPSRSRRSGRNAHATSTIPITAYTARPATSGMPIPGSTASWTIIMSSKPSQMQRTATASPAVWAGEVAPSSPVVRDQARDTTSEPIAIPAHTMSALENMIVNRPEYSESSGKRSWSTIVRSCPVPP